MKIMLCNYMGGSGKDTVAQMLVDKHGFKAYALADGIYEICEKYYGLKEKNREMLHFVGETLRKKDCMLWINYTLKRIEDDGHDKIVITDVRKLLELSYLQEMGFNPLMVYCDEEKALRRIEQRDGKGNVSKDLILNSSLENQLRPLKDHISIIDNSNSIKETEIQLQKYLALH